MSGAPHLRTAWRSAASGAYLTCARASEPRLGRPLPLEAARWPPSPSSARPRAPRAPPARLAPLRAAQSPPRRAPRWARSCARCGLQRFVRAATRLGLRRDMLCGALTSLGCVARSVALALGPATAAAVPRSSSSGKTPPAPVRGLLRVPRAWGLPGAAAPALRLGTPLPPLTRALPRRRRHRGQPGPQRLRPVRSRRPAGPPPRRAGTDSGPLAPCNA